MNTSTWATMEATMEVKVGSCIRPENWTEGERLIASDWDHAAFRLPRPNATYGDPIQSVSVNVVVTGRTWQRKNGGHWVRVQVEFVRDGGEPSTFSGGWMLVD